MAHHLAQLGTALLVSFPLAPLHAQVTDAGPDTTLCVDFYTMQGSALPPGAIGDWTVVMGCGDSSDPNDPLQLVTNLCTGTSVFQWTVNDSGAISTDQVTITVYDANALSNAGPDQTAWFPPAAAILSATACSWPCQCHWDTSYYTFSDPFDPNAIVSNLMVGPNPIAWVCDNGPCPGGPMIDYVIVDLQSSPTSIPLVGDPPSSSPMRFDADNGQVTIDGTVPASRFAVLDMSGRVVMMRPAIQPKVDVSELGPGIYVAQASFGGTVHSLRFAVSH